MRYKVISTKDHLNIQLSTSIKIDVARAQSRNEDEFLEILKKTEHETYPEPYYVKAIEISELDFLDNSTRQTFIKVMKGAGFTELTGIFFYLSNKMNHIDSLLANNKLLLPYKSQILKRLVAGFPILAIKKVMEDTDVCYGLVEFNKKMFWANKAALDVLGISLFDLIGKSIEDITEKGYSLWDQLKKQLFHFRFIPYFLNWLDKMGMNVPTLVKPGPVVGRMTYGAIFRLKDIFNNELGTNVFAKKNYEYYQSFLKASGFTRLVTDIERQANNGDLKVTTVMHKFAQFFNCNQAFLINLSHNQTQKTVIQISADKAIEIHQKNVLNQREKIYLNDLVENLNENFYLYISEKQTSDYSYLKEIFTKNYKEITSCIVVPIKNEKDEIIGILGVSSNQHQLAEFIGQDNAYQWMDFAAQKILGLWSFPERVAKTIAESIRRNE